MTYDNRVQNILGDASLKQSKASGVSNREIDWNRLGQPSERTQECLDLDSSDSVTALWWEMPAWTAGILALISLFLIWAEPSWSAEPPRGMAPGARTFSNPGAAAQPNPVIPPNPFSNSAGTPPVAQPPFFDEDDEDYEFPEERANNPGVNRPSVSAGGQPSSEGSDPIRTDKGISLGGGTSGGVIARGKKEVNALKIDDETGEGSKEIVTDFNFPDADIMDIAKTLGKLTGKNFILDKEVKGRITIISNAPITVGDAWKAFLTALDMNNFALIPSGKYIRISRQRDAREKQLRTYTGDKFPDSDALITKVFPLKYISSEEVARTFRSFMPTNSRIIPYEQTNTVIVTDTGANISKLQKMLDILDVEGFDAGIEVINVKYASALELSKLIDALVPGSPTGGAGGPPGTPRFGGGGGRFSARRTKEGGIINTIIADERTNTLIVHANGKGADQVRELVARLDQEKPAKVGGKVHVIHLQYGDAEKIAGTLNNISQNARGSTPGAATPAGGTGINPASQALFEGSIKVSPDASTNSLVITASPADLVTVQRVVNSLDIPRDEVYVEVVIMEVNLTSGMTFSANVAGALSPNGPGIFASSPSTDLTSFIASPLAAIGKSALISWGSGQTVDVTNPATNTTTKVSSVMGLVKAIQTTTNSNILATPQIIALDNSEATFSSTEKFPVNQSTTTQGVTANTIAYQSVPLSIKIKPQINKLVNFVKLEVETEMGDINKANVPDNLSASAFATLERKAKTTVVAGDSDTMIIGGLIRDKVTDAVSKIPLLGDIPLLGWLFRSKISETSKSNLLIFMTPHIVRQYEKVRAILDKKLQERDDFLEASNGGNDPQKAHRDRIIRSLPEIADFKETPWTINAKENQKEEGATVPAAKVVSPEANRTGLGGPSAGGTSLPPAPPTGDPTAGGSNNVMDPTAPPPPVAPPPLQ